VRAESLIGIRERSRRRKGKCNGERKGSEGIKGNQKESMNRKGRGLFFAKMKGVF